MAIAWPKYRKGGRDNKNCKILSASQSNITAMRMAKEIRKNPETQLALGLLWQDNISSKLYPNSTVQ
jgi:hypothetical protein